MKNNIIVLIFLMAGMIFSARELNAQPKRVWTKPVVVTTMNGGKITVSYSCTDKDSIFYRISSKCSGLTSIYTCFSFKYQDRNNMEHTQSIRDIPLSKSFEKEFAVPAQYGITKITAPFLKESIVAYIDDFTNDSAFADN